MLIWAFFSHTIKRGIHFLTRSYNHIFYRTNPTIAQFVPQDVRPLRVETEIAFDLYFLREPSFKTM